MGMMSTRWGAAGEPCPLTHLPQPPRQLGDDVGSELTHAAMAAAAWTRGRGGTGNKGIGVRREWLNREDRGAVVLETKLMQNCVEGMRRVTHLVQNRSTALPNDRQNLLCCAGLCCAALCLYLCHSPASFSSRRRRAWQLRERQ